MQLSEESHIHVQKISVIAFLALTNIVCGSDPLEQDDIFYLSSIINVSAIQPPLKDR